MVDSLKIYEILKESSLPENQARAMTKAIQTAETEIALDVKTVLEQQLTFFKESFATKADFSDFKADVTKELGKMESRLTNKMFAFWVGQSAVTVGLLYSALKLFK